MTTSTATARRRDFPGWWMVWSLAGTLTVAYAALFYCFAVMVVPMRDALDASTGQLSGALSLAIAVNGATAVPVGRLLDQYGARWVMSGGSVLGALSVVAWSQAQSLPQLYLAFVGVGAAGACVLYEPAFAVVNTWFRRDRAGALLTLTVVAGFSSTIFLPLSQALVQAYGWRAALLVLAGLLGACAIPQALLLRRAPEDLGLHPDGSHAPPDEEPDTAAPVAGAQWVRRDRAVRALTAAAALEAVAVTVVAVHLVAYLRDTGAGASRAAAAAGALGVLSVAGRIALTGLATRVGLARLAAGMVAGQALGLAALLVLPRPAGLVVFVVLFGAGFGVMTIARPALLSGYVPGSVYGSVAGVQALAANAGRLVAPAAAGAAISLAGYRPALVGVAVCSVLAAAALLAGDRAHARRPA